MSPVPSTACQTEQKRFDAGGVRLLQGDEDEQAEKDALGDVFEMLPSA